MVTRLCKCVGETVEMLPSASQRVVIAMVEDGFQNFRIALTVK